MIYGNICNKSSYEKFEGVIEKGFNFLLNNDLEKLPVGKHIILKDMLYANVDEYKTKFEGLSEAHRKFIDIQVIVKGSEIIKYTDLSNCENSNGYNEEKDIEFFQNSKNLSEIHLEKGDFAIFFPQDAHMPQLNDNKSEIVKKIVLKVSV